MSTQAQILVVDDEAVTRTGLEQILTYAGYAVTTASSGAEALEVLRGRRFEMLITDLQMPGMDGFELLQALKQQGAQFPVLVLTGHGTMETVVQALRYGVNDFLSKPYHPEELLSIVEREVARYRRSLPPGADKTWELRLSPQVLDRLDDTLAQLRAEVNARCVLLLESSGAVIASKGALQEINVSALTALIAGDFAATAGVASLLGEQDAFRLNYHQGETYSVYSAQVLPTIFLLIIFGQEIKLGTVMYYARRALEEAREILPPAPLPVPSSAPATTSDLSPVPVPSTPPETAVEAEAEAAGAELYSLEQTLEQGLLAPELLDVLDEQLNQMWKEE